ncbi:hypothetical protein JTB14_014582 [Gonioctena quinquepunctata]|nr:hypothetical protein JTB14_014582 [Gonioctena quinquepunctata]
MVVQEQSKDSGKTDQQLVLFNKTCYPSTHNLVSFNAYQREVILFHSREIVFPLLICLILKSLLEVYNQSTVHEVSNNVTLWFNRNNRFVIILFSPTIARCFEISK